MEAAENRVYEFGPFRLNPSEGVLIREGRAIPLTPKAYEILVCLLHHAGHVLAKDALMQEVWPDTFVEEGNLKVNISALRRALGDTTEESAFIETIPRRGYRFVAPVHVAGAAASPMIAEGPVQLTVERRKFERRVTEEVLIEDAPEAEAATQALPAAIRPASRTRLWWSAAVLAVMVLTLLVMLAIPALRAPKAGGGAVARVTYAGGRLQAWNEANQLAWSYQFEIPVEEPRTTNHTVLFTDLDGDGSREMVVVVAGQHAGGFYPPVTRVACFSARGELRWSYQPNLTLSFGGKEYQGPWVVRDIMASPDPQHPGVWVAYAHHTWWPSFLVRINVQGLADMRFINSGHITRLDSVTNPLGSFVLAGALNNEYGGAAALAILRDGQTFAASPQSPGTEFWCDQCPEDRPFRYFVFPRSELNRLEGQGYNPFHAIASAAGQIRLLTTELPGSSDFVYGGVYALNSKLELVEAGYSEMYWTRHDQLYKEGRLDHSAADCPERKHAAVKLWEPEHGWREPALAVAEAR